MDAEPSKDAGVREESPPVQARSTTETTTRPGWSLKVRAVYREILPAENAVIQPSRTESFAPPSVLVVTDLERKDAKDNPSPPAPLPPGEGVGMG